MLNVFRGRKMFRLRGTVVPALVILSISYMGMLSQSQTINPSKPPPEPNFDAGGNRYWGVVTELTKTTITVQHGKDEPKLFPVSGTLASGGIPSQPRPFPGRQRPYSVAPIEMFRLSDVKVGDWVDINYSKVDGVVTCEHICINKRPGGMIPPLPEEAEALLRPRRIPGTEQAPYIPWNEFMNAYWDLEDRGIPYPEKFGNKRRWLTAPMPREVQPTPRPKG